MKQSVISWTCDKNGCGKSATVATEAYSYASSGPSGWGTIRISSAEESEECECDCHGYNDDVGHEEDDCSCYSAEEATDWELTLCDTCFTEAKGRYPHPNSGQQL